MHSKNRTYGADTIIVGSSHAMNGIIEKELYNAGEVLSFCISSQDLYYDFEHIKKALREEKKPIKRCIVNLGYYMLFQDVSKSQLVRGIIPKVYMNLFEGTDCVNNFVDAKKINPLDLIAYDHEKYPPEILGPIVKHWATQAMIEQSSFYGELKTRENNNMLGVKKVEWNTLSEEEKNDYAKNRTENGHNKHIKHIETRKENGKILEEMVSLLDEHNVKVYFLITPYTKAYMRYINHDYEPDIFETLNNLKTEVEYFDMNTQSDLFDDTDFIDSDHLNLKGAHKATAIFNNYIQASETG